MSDYVEYHVDCEQCRLIGSFDDLNEARHEACAHVAENVGHVVNIQGETEPEYILIETVS